MPRERVFHEPEAKEWDATWSQPEILAKPNFAVVRALLEASNGSVAGLKALEVGAGRAIDLICLVRLGARGFAIDFNERSFGISRRFAQRGKIEIIPCQANARRIPLASESMDIVFSQGLLEHFETPLELIEEQARVAKKGGLVLVDVPQLFSLQALIKTVPVKLGIWPFGWEANLTEEQLRSLLKKAGLTPLLAYGWKYIPPLNLGVRRALARLAQGDNIGLPDNFSRESPEWKFQKTFLARHLLGCVGVVARKG